MASLFEFGLIDDDEAFDSLARSDEDASRAFLKYSFCLSEKSVSAEVTANTTSLTEKIAGFGNSLARCIVMKDQSLAKPHKPIDC